jgi:hypothetical protein
MGCAVGCGPRAGGVHRPRPEAGRRGRVGRAVQARLGDAAGARRQRADRPATDPRPGPRRDRRHGPAHRDRHPRRGTGGRRRYRRPEVRRDLVLLGSVPPVAPGDRRSDRHRDEDRHLARRVRPARVGREAARLGHPPSNVERDRRGGRGAQVHVRDDQPGGVELRLLRARRAGRRARRYRQGADSGPDRSAHAAAAGVLRGPVADRRLVRLAGRLLPASGGREPLHRRHGELRIGTAVAQRRRQAPRAADHRVPVGRRGDRRLPAHPARGRGRPGPDELRRGHRLPAPPVGPAHHRGAAGNR